MRVSHVRFASSVLALAVASTLAGAARAEDQAAPDAAKSAAGMPEIVVTANRREEAIQKVAVAVTALSGDQVRQQNIQSAADLAGKFPSLYISSGGNQRNVEVVIIRGQGQTYLSPIGVVNYFAEVPLIQGGITAIQGGPGMFFDLQNLQVLRGPQGTLFGKNTTGGAVLLGPKKPTNDFGGYMQAQYGNYNDFEIEGAVNIPLIQDKLLVRLSGKKIDRDGYTKDVGPKPYGFNNVCAPSSTSGGGCVASSGFAGRDYDDRHNFHLRANILFRPTDSIEDNLIGYYGAEHDNGSGFVLDSVRSRTRNNINDFSVSSLAGISAFNVNSSLYVPGGPTPLGFNLAGGNGVAQQILDAQAALGPRQTAMNQLTFERTRAWGVINTLSIHLNDNLLVKNITGYQRQKQNYSWDLDGSILPILSQNPPIVAAAGIADAKSLAASADPSFLVGSTPGQEVNISNQGLFTSELQLLGQALDNKFNWVVGGFYSKQTPKGLQATGSFNAATFNPGTFYAITTTSKAVFAQGSIDLGAMTPGLDGLKATGGIRYTWDTIDGSRYANGYVLLPLVLHDVIKSEATTWTLGLDYQASQNVLVYGKVTKGYKAGAFNYTGPALADLEARPEHVTNYEIGFKSDFHLGSVPVRFNVSAFDLEYKDIQRAAAQNVSNGCLDVVIANRPARCTVVGNRTGLDQGAVVFNAEKARVRGIELEGAIEPVPGIRLSGSYSYIDAKYLQYHQQLPPKGSTDVPVDTCDVQPGGDTFVSASATGYTTINTACIPFQQTPKNQWTINARFEIPVDESVGKVAFNVNHSMIGSVFNGAGRTRRDEPYATIAGYALWNASFEWNGIMNSPVDLRVFATNLTNRLYRVNAYTGANGGSGFTQSLYGEPRMFGASLRVRFGAEGENR